MRKLVVILALIQTSLSASIAQAAPVLGNEGGGGGSVIRCSDTPVLKLTDLYEAEQSNPALTPKLEELRAMTEPQALNYVAKRLAKFLDLTLPNGPEAVAQIRALLRANYFRLAFGQVTDPKDSGELTLGPGCREERVAVNSNFKIYGSIVEFDFSSQYVTAVKSLWFAMSPFDRYALLTHEILYAATEGRVYVSEMDPSVKREKNSANIRRLVAFALTGDLKAAATPKSGPRYDCYAGTEKVRRADSQWDRIHFDIFPQGISSQVQVTNAWGVPVYLPNVGHNNLSIDTVQLQGTPDNNPHSTYRLVPGGPLPLTTTGQPEPLVQYNFQTGKMETTDIEISFHAANDTSMNNAPLSVFMKAERVYKNGTREVLMDGYVLCHQPK